MTAHQGGLRWLRNYVREALSSWLDSSLQALIQGCCAKCLQSLRGHSSLAILVRTFPMWTIRRRQLQVICAKSLNLPVIISPDEGFLAICRRQRTGTERLPTRVIQALRSKWGISIWPELA